VRDKGKNRKVRRAKVAGLLLLGAALIAASLPKAEKQRTVFIDTPGACYGVEKVEGEKVVLRSAKENCNPLIRVQPVEIDPSIRTVRVYANGALWKEQKIPDLAPLIAQSADEDKGKAAADNLARAFESEDVQKTLQAEKERLKSTLFKTPERFVGNSQDRQSASSHLLPSERIYLFVSSSIPVSTLRNYAKDLDKLSDPGVTVVMRGFVGGMKHARPTMEFISGVIIKDPGCTKRSPRCDAYRVNVEIDPALFRKYQITRVPALVYVPHLPVSEGVQEENPAGDYDAVYGDASLSYLLGVLHQKTKSGSIAGVLAALEK